MAEGTTIGTFPTVSEDSKVSEQEQARDSWPPRNSQVFALNQFVSVQQVRELNK